MTVVECGQRIRGVSGEYLIVNSWITRWIPLLRLIANGR